MPRISVSLRNSLLAGAAAVAVATAAPHPSRAQMAVTCVNCSTVATQLLQWAKQVAQYEAQLQQLQYEINSYINLVTNTLNLPNEVWTMAESDVNRVRNLTNQASLLTGSIGTTIGNLNNPAGYTPQLAAFAANWPQQLTTWNNTVGNAYQNLGQVLQLQSTQQASDLSVLTALQNQNPAGRLQALQIAHELAMAEAKELHEMDVTMTAASQTQQTTNAIRAEKEAVEDAAWQRMLQFTPLPTTGQSFSVSQP
ncbi:MAG: hypothetical protein ACREE4_09340 [Stellaceae bacterium]